MDGDVGDGRVRQPRARVAGEDAAGEQHDERVDEGLPAPRRRERQRYAGAGAIGLLVVTLTSLARPVADINPGMLGVGRERAEKRGLSLDFVEANAEEMPFADAGFDAVTIAFGIRNVTDIPKALRDIRRVLKWGGRFYCLEFSSSEWPGFAKLYDEYTLKLVPKVGAVVADDEEAYRYLAESIKRFPPMPAFAKMIEEAGFKQVNARPILGGAVAIHSGWKI